MIMTRLKTTIASLKLIFSRPAESHLGRRGARCASNSPPNVEELIPYSAKDLKYMWTLWDEAKRHQHSGMRYRNIYVGSVSLILTGWLMHGLSFSALGSILMLAGALIGIWFCLKSRRLHKDSTMGG